MRAAEPVGARRTRRLSLGANKRATLVLPVLIACLLLAGPWIGASQFWQLQIILIAIYALIVSGINLGFGYAGELALGQVALFAAGAYVTGWFSIHVTAEVAPNLILSLAAVCVLGFVCGIPGIRVGGWALAMLSFFLVILIPDLLQIFQKYTGGAGGLIGIPAPQVLGHVISGEGYYELVVALTVVWLLLFRNFVLSPHGLSLRVLRESPTLASTLGVSVFRLKLTAYIGGSLPAGIAGCLYAYLDQYVGPDAFDFSAAISLIAASIIGGSDSVYGAVVGAAILQLVALRSTGFVQYSLIVYGAFLLVGGLAFRSGIAGTARQLLQWGGRRWESRSQASETEVESQPGSKRVAAEATDRVPPEWLARSDSSRLLETVAVEKYFGGVHALDDVTLRFAPGKVNALIGSNGSGKTTLLNVISGVYRVTAGTVKLDGREIQGLPAQRVARLGISRTFQTPLIPPRLTAVEVVRTGSYTTLYAGIFSTILRLPRFLKRRREQQYETVELLRLVGLENVRDVEGAKLPLGQRRLLEVARALALRPAVLMLDEPASGLDDDDLALLASVIRLISAAGTTVILVEHNVSFVADLADVIHVLARGRLLASGEPRSVIADPAVVESYFGSKRAEGLGSQLEKSQPQERPNLWPPLMSTNCIPGTETSGSFGA
jgi:branched-chain amino acid transport system permease protein